MIPEATTVRVTARQRFVSLLMSRQQQEVVELSGKEHKQFDPDR